MNFEGCTLAIIAGGRGTRLGGVDKAQLRLPDGRTLLQRMQAELGPLFEQTLIVREDLIPQRGAPGGVHAACAQARTEWVLALAVDLPRVNVHVLRWLWDQRAEGDAVVARVDGHAEPLHAFYRARVCADAFGRVLRERSTSLTALFDEVQTRNVEEDDLRRLDPQLDSFLNVNTPDDLRLAGLTLP